MFGSSAPSAAGDLPYAAVAALLMPGPGDDDDDDDDEGGSGGGSGGNIDPDDDEGCDDDDDDEDEEPLQVAQTDAKPRGRGAGCRASYPRRPPTRTAPTRRGEAIAA